MVRELCRTLTEVHGAKVLLAQFDLPNFELGTCSIWRAEEAPSRLDGHTWGAFATRGEWCDELDAREVHPRRLRGVMEYAAAHYDVVLADLTGAKEPHVMEALHSSESIFVVSGGGPASLEIVREKAAWLRTVNLAERCSLLLRPEAGGAARAEAAERTGLPVVSLIVSGEDLRRMAESVAGESLEAESPVAEPDLELAASYRV